MKNKIIAMVLVATVAVPVAAQADADSTSIAHRIEVSAREGYVMPSNLMLRGGNKYNSKVRSAFGASVEYGFSFAPSSRYGRLYPTAYQGIGVGFNGFSSSKITGTPVNIYVLQGARLANFSSRLSLDYEWNFGVSAGWRKNSDPNKIISTDDIDGFGSRLNAYIDLGFKLNYALSERLDLVAGINISHFSNGNTNYPNPGVNVLWGKVGVVYKPGRLQPVRHADWSGYERHVSYDLTLYGAWRKNLFNYGAEGSEPKDHPIPGHFGLCGLNFNPLYHFKPMLSLGASLDMQYEQGANLSPYYEPSTPIEDPKFYRQPFSHRMMIGLSARAELQMPIFAVNIGIGHSLYAPGGPDLRGWYQTFTLKTFITRHLYLSTGYRLVRFKNPGNLMLGLGWRFNAR